MTEELKLVVYVIMSLAVAAAVSFIATPVVRTFARKVGAIDVPKDERRMHKVPIPRLGGLAIFFGFLLSVLLFADINRQIQGILLGSAVIVILGVFDDMRPLPAWFKFIIQICAALIAAYYGVQIERLSNPNIFSGQLSITLGSWGIPITVLWIVAITNSVNLIDGLDGLAVGVSTICSLAMLVIAFMVSVSNVAIIMAAVAGACIGFLPYNLNPARIFMGDTGATFLGFILATVSIVGLFKFYAVVSFFVPFLILGLPIFDTSFAFIRRILHGQNPMHADRSHVHHKLIDLGLNQKQAVAILYVLTAILGLCAVLLASDSSIKVLLLIFAVLIVCVIGVAVIFKNGAHHNHHNVKPEGSAPVFKPDDQLCEDVSGEGGREREKADTPSEGENEQN
ncbi:MAG: glycosyltransferase family 4 protein [Oscillospiraceae bacterium]|jgi:UDP-GlcNAc:undecaprenyl-phosphate GlcNAc-1-phosphate transferase